MMSKTMITLIVGVLLGAAGWWLISTVSGGESTPAAEVAVILPDLPEPYYKVLFENEAVRIVDHQLGTGETEPEHTHPPMVAYFVEGATVLITEANDSTWEATIPTGAFPLGDSLYWWTHSLENTGDTPLHSILVEFKGYPREN
ncbi:MAG: hypothetical protein ACYSUI_12680 [Planctomycetota bacterium]|jgi:hypothetical protein